MRVNFFEYIRKSREDAAKTPVIWNPVYTPSQRPFIFQDDHNSSNKRIQDIIQLERLREIVDAHPYDNGENKCKDEKYPFFAYNTFWPIAKNLSLTELPATSIPILVLSGFLSCWTETPRAAYDWIPRVINDYSERINRQQRMAIWTKYSPGLVKKYLGRRYASQAAFYHFEAEETTRERMESGEFRTGENIVVISKYQDDEDIAKVIENIIRHNR